MKTHELTRFRECEEALKLPELKQALYDEGAILMDRVLVTLHGEEHRARRLTEMRVFRRDFFRRYEQEVIPAIFSEVMGPLQGPDGKPADAAGQPLDLVHLCYQFMAFLALTFAGIDRQEHTQQELDDLVGMLRMFGVAATLGQAKDPDTQAKEQAVRLALREFDERFFTPSAKRRQRLIDQVAAGQLDAQELPMDVLTVLLQDEHNLQLVRDMLLRETAFYFLASAHTSVHSLGHAMHHLFTWCADNPGERSALVADPVRVQRFVHESFRLHPSSPISKRRALAALTLPNGSAAAAGDIVIVSLRDANRDTEVFGADAADFNPGRQVARGVNETGITFGIGMHACLGKNLAAGVLPVPGKPLDPEKHQFGTVAWIAHALLQAGVAPHPTIRPELDQAIARETWLRYPVVIG